MINQSSGSAAYKLCGMDGLFLKSVLIFDDGCDRWVMMVMVMVMAMVVMKNLHNHHP
jgi:hypothetical protein